MRERQIAKVRELEETAELLQFSVPETGALLWPLVRYAVFNQCLYQLGRQAFGLEFARSPQPSKFSKYGSFFTTLPRFMRGWPARAKIIIHHDNSHTNLKVWKGKPYCQYIEPFAESLSADTVLFDNSSGPQSLSQDRAYPVLGIRHAIEIAAKYTRVKIKQSGMETVTAFISFIRGRIQKLLNIELPESFYQEMKQQVFDYAFRYAVAEYNVYKKYLGKLRPQFLLINQALYGRYGHLMLLGKELGIATMDIQHGMIFTNHTNYTWGEQISANTLFTAQYPDYFLTYGTFWHAQMRLPGTRPVPIGNPWFSMQTAGLTCQPGSQPMIVLFALGAYYDEYIPFISKLKIALPPDSRIAVRPHPLVDAQAYKIFREPGIEVDTNKNIYESLNAASVVIGDVSTVLYEAAAIGKRVFSFIVEETKNAPMPFESFSHPDELVEKLFSPDVGRLPQAQRNMFFAPDWEKNYKSFINSM